MSRLIRCIVTREKKNPKERFILLSALAGDIERVEKTLGGTISVEDPTLTEEEGYSIANNFPHFGHGKGKAAPLPFELTKDAELPTPSVKVVEVTLADESKEFHVVSDRSNFVNQPENGTFESKVGFFTSSEELPPSDIEITLKSGDPVQPAKRGRKPKQQ